MAAARAQQADPQVYDHASIDWKAYQSAWLKDLPRATSNEPMLSEYSETKAAAFLDEVALKWARQNRCGTCHTTISYLMARPLIGPSAAWTEVRATISRFASDQVAKRSPTAAFVAASTVAALALGDEMSGRTFQPDTRALFDYLWVSQDSDGNWRVPRDGLVPFLERDRYYRALLVALAIGYVPGRYYDDPSAKAGFARLQAFLRSNPAPNAHDEAVLLWASVRAPGLLNSKEQENDVHSLLALQKPDGGWALPSMGTWPRHDGAPNDPNGASDGYATALATLVLCQLGYTPKDDAVRWGLTWIRTHQRVSGRWFTRSLYSDRFQNYISNMATAYAVMALHSCAAVAPLPRLDSGEMVSPQLSRGR